MRQCNDYLEQISAYADGELSSESDIRDVEAHLAVCESCAAYYAFSREISTAAAESLVEPPRELMSRVMTQVMNEPGPGEIATIEFVQTQDKASSAKYEAVGRKSTAPSRQSRENSRNLRRVMTRLVPLAACLALVVLVWQFWGNLERAAMPADYAAAPGANEVLVTAESYAGDAPADVVEESEMNIDEAVDLGGFNYDTDDSHPGEREHDGVAEAEPPPGAAPEEQCTLATAGGDVDLRRLFGRGGDFTEEELDYIYAHAVYASFIITITDEFPELSIMLEPAQTAQIARGEMIFEITTDEALRLLDELAYSAVEYEILEQNPNMPYAIVLFSVAG